MFRLLHAVDFLLLYNPDMSVWLYSMIPRYLCRFQWLSAVSGLAKLELACLQSKYDLRIIHGQA